MTRAPKQTLRIAAVSDSVYPFHKGGKEKRLYEITRRLTAKGHDVHIYTMKWWDGPNTIRQDGLTLHAICKLHPLYSHNRRSMREAVFFGLATFKLLFAKFDLIDVDSMPFFPLLSARLVCWLRGKRLHATWHEVTTRQSWQEYAGRAAGLVGWLIERAATMAPDVIIANSPHTAARLRREFPHKDVRVVTLGVDLDAIYAIKPDPSKRDIIFVGRLVAHKNVDKLIEAVKLLKQHRPGVTCHIIGAGPEKDRLARLITELGLEQSIELLDPIEDHSELYAMIKAAKVFVLPSTREGFSLVAVEAQAAGVPVITTPHPDNAARDFITEGINGYLSEPTPQDLAKTIQKVLGSRTLKPGTGIEQYDWKHVVANLEKALTA